MGISGKRPDPTPIRLLKNDKKNQHRYAGKEEPEPSSELPTAPDYLSDRAKEIFEDFVDRVSEMYPPSKTDMDIIVLYANNKEQLESYEYTLRTEGSVVTTHVMDKKGDIYEGATKSRPEVNMLKECKNLQMKILTEFGLTPSSRCRINLKPQKKTEKTNAFAGIKKKSKTG